MNSISSIAITYSAISLCFALSANAQSSFHQSTIEDKDFSTEVKRDWHNVSFEEHKIYGTAANRVHQELIQGKQPKKKIVVAVIDSGVDVEHEDLQGSVWVNDDEIEGNGIDDDNNGYVDDVHGWNFVVDANNQTIRYDNLEATRILAMRDQLDEEDWPEWLTNENINRAADIYNGFVDEYKGLLQFATFYQVLDSILTDELGTPDYTFEEAMALDHSADPMKSIYKFLNAMQAGGITQADFIDMAATVEKFEQYHLNYGYHPHPLRQDDERRYGNNDYEGEDASHGTHVAGLIAANRINNTGARGVAHGCVEIMSIKAVPDGDERDIDVANAIRYAVDNGADIINMSFGKGLSPRKYLVDAAVKYAGENNVLLIHAAGNDSENNDLVANFPNPMFNSGTRAKNFMTIGASSISKKKDLVAAFSNYGLSEVEMFAPGHQVYSTVPDDGYKSQSGTSMAAPVASGVAALVWAYHPELSAEELRSILMESVTTVGRKRVKLPGEKKKVRFRSLCVTGGIVNAYEAFKLAAERTDTDS